MTRRNAASRLLPLLFVAGVAGAAPPALQPYSADYMASYMGVQATGHMVLAQQGGGRWLYSLNIGSPVAQLSQSTVFDLGGGALRPLSGNDTSAFLFKHSQKQASYDWNSRQARWSGDVKPDRTGPVALQPGDVDGMLLNLALPRDLAAGRPLQYRMVDNGRAKRVDCTTSGSEAVAAGGKRQQATRIDCDLGSGKQAVLWVVDGIPFPVRILQRKDGKDDIDLRLR